MHSRLDDDRCTIRKSTTVAQDPRGLMRSPSPHIVLRSEVKSGERLAELRYTGVCMPIVHNTFGLERSYSFSAERVFAAWATIEGKAKWFSGPLPWQLVKRDFDFRVGGAELLHGRYPGDHDTVFAARYHHIEPGRFIVYDYDMSVDGIRISSSLVTIELAAAGAQTRMLVTEQGVFFDGLQSAGSREKGTAQLIEKLGASL